MKLLTRRQIIDIWKEQPDNMLDSYCCPNCRDLLDEDENTYFCSNVYCLEDFVTSKKDLEAL